MTSDNMYFWASSLSGVFKVKIEAEKMDLVGYMPHNIDFQFHGSYSFVDHNDQF